MRNIILIPLLSSFALCASAQSTVLKSRITDTGNKPVEGAIISVSENNKSVITDSIGHFSIDTSAKKGFIKIAAEGYYEVEFPVTALPGQITLIPVTAAKYSGDTHHQFYNERRDNKSAIVNSVEKKDFLKGTSIDVAIQGEVAGLDVIRKGGMPGEGAYINLRGVHSFVAENNPLIVINGVPYLGSQDISGIINGYSRNMLFGYNVDNIKSITVLKGAEASQYGSLASNGVILVETEQATSDNLETIISFTGQYGVNAPGKYLPVMGPDSYRNYVRDIGMTRYDKMSSLLADYTFLQNESNYYSYLFNNNTDWIKQVQGNTFVTDNMFRVEGGDEIAKYNISLGYTSDGGVVGSTRSDKYHTLINSNIMVNRDVDIFTNVGLSYTSSTMQEQGLVAETNPILTAYNISPLLSPFKKESNGNILGSYSTYYTSNTNSNPTYAYDNVSNPLAIVNTLDAKDKIYDANMRIGMNYRIGKSWTLTGVVNIIYNYTEETVFIPGVTDQAIVPQVYGTGLNAAKKGVMESNSYYYNFNAKYENVFNNIHDVRAYSGVRYLGNKAEYDYAAGYNTANDFYGTLNQVTDEKDIFGRNQEWKWLNYYLHGDYVYNHILKASVNMGVDGTSVSGVDTQRFGFFPSVGLTYMMANAGILPEVISLFNISAEYSKTGNSRFSSNYAKNYYDNSNFFTLGTIVRSNVPNTKLQWENKDQYDLGVDISLFSNKINLGVNAFYAYSYDLLLNKTISAVYGSSKYYDNIGEISSKGFEASLRLNPINSKNLDWVIGATASMYKSKVESLGNDESLTINFESYNDKDAMVMLKVGESPYQFYGYKTNGIYKTSDEAKNAGLANHNGLAYQAGDIRFIDQNDDNVINANDKVLLGSATPDLFGSFYTTLRYKQFSLFAQFGYSWGNKAYNALRRDLESMDNFNNQSTATLNRWQVEGQQTNMPRAAYGDPSLNNVFSDRWIEDASYIKLRNVTLSYNFDNTFIRAFRSGSIYITGENLITFTKYLGSDPEFAFSYNEAVRGIDYGKVALPRAVKVGFNLNF